MKCPRCNTVPMAFGWFLLIGWVRIRCRNCSSRLVVQSVGNRFWSTLAGGAIGVAAVVSFLDTPHRQLGEKGTIFLFLSLVMLTLISAAYFAWKDCRFRLAKSSEKDPHTSI